MSNKSERVKSRNPKVAKTQTSESEVDSLMNELAARANAAWQKSVEEIIECGKILIEAKKKVGHGNWLVFVDKLEFDQDTASRLIKIAEHPVLSNSAHVRNLPRTWSTLYRMTEFEPDELEGLLSKGTIDSQTERKEVEALLARRERRGVTKYEQIVEALATLNKFVKHWPQLNPVLVECMADGLTSVQPNIDADDHAGLHDLPKISAWLSDLQHACTETVQRWQNEDEEPLVEPIRLARKRRQRRDVDHNEARA